MKLALILSFYLLGNITTSISGPPEPEIGKRWVLQAQYSDEFNGSELDESKWRKSFSGWQGRAPGYFSPHTISVEEGMLRIKNGVLDEKVKEHSKSAYSISGGAVQSVEKTAHFGYYECKFKASRINMSTTFWMSNTKAPVNFQTKKSNGNCAKDRFSQELDIAESIGGTIDRGDKFRKYMNFNTHYRYIDCEGGREKFYSAGNNAVEGNGSASNAKLSSESWEDFHTYGAYWKDANQVAFYADNKFVGDVKISTDVVDEPFSAPMGINMVTETYNWVKPYPTNEELNNDAINTSYYDWVRSYELVDIDVEISDDTNFKKDAAPIYIEEVRFFETPKLAKGKVEIPYVYKANTNRIFVFKLYNAENKVVFETTFTLLSGYGKNIKTIALPQSFTDQDYTFVGELQSIDGTMVLDTTEEK